ncbi:urokinase plasminogen activator surface receptor-like [Anabas testudineus]|uniref:urokinase plasminogen activator surface receptor-like n=1 Tax=Anabas testudineus TaxID=64144 RepID=UPI000E46443F|nr:urokinase plasminogen activator surface receptor-like [Anabas testudineus]
MLVQFSVKMGLILIWMLFSTAAGALQCQNCIDNQCSNTTCLPGMMCTTISIQVNSSTSTVSKVFKMCASTPMCPDNRAQTFSVSLVNINAVASVKCCNTDNCNSATLASVVAQSENSQQCFSCDPLTSQCTTLNCKGEEKSCFRASVYNGSTTLPRYGCTSANLCVGLHSLTRLLFLYNIDNFSSGLTCCGSSLCNTAPATALTPIHLLLGLLVFTLY